MHDDLRTPYQTGELPTLQIGGIILDDKVLKNAPVNLVLKAFNRHGLIAGATGSGKTKTMQVLCEQLSHAGVPSLVMDIKGDISGLAMPGESSPALLARSQSLNLSFTPQNCPVELFTLDEEIHGIPLRATVDNFGPLLFSRMLNINETQAGVVTILFEYAKDNQMPLMDLNDFKDMLQYIQTREGKLETESRYGTISSASVGAIMRKIIELESQGGQYFFGEPAFDVMDLIRRNSEGQGIISILRLMNMQDRPLLFSTFMLKLLSDVYRQLPETGDPDKPMLVLFIDEAHLIFKNSSKALLNVLETMVKLIRSKGVGIIFCTQTPNDIPDAVLSQLGLKIQHALRAFTAKDRQAMKLVAQNFPPSEYYNTERLLTSLGTGEALVSALDGQGQPTPLIKCLLRAPESRMGTLSDTEVTGILNRSELFRRYGKRINSQSASEILTTKKNQQTPATQSGKPEPSMIEKWSKNTMIRQIIRDTFRSIVKMLMSGWRK